MSNILGQVTSVPDERQQSEKMRSYYAFHAKIYEMTRWTFLFGRREAIEWLKLPLLTRKRLLEVGCGTGYNLRRLRKGHPNLMLLGLDLSTDMLEVAQKNIVLDAKTALKAELYGGTHATGASFGPDIVLCSYTLSMINPGYEAVIRQAFSDLPPGGKMVVVDFQYTRWPFFKRWMQANHVEMENHLLPTLQAVFKTERVVSKKAYFGLWRYFIYIGTK